jgi:cell pole-organizing protein PopZ
MTQAAKAQEPSMEEILASIRRIIADDEGDKPPEAGDSHSSGAAANGSAQLQSAPEPDATASAPAPADPGAVSDSEIDTMLAEFDRSGGDAEEPQPQDTGDVLELTQAMQAPQPRPANFRTVEPETDVVFSERPAASAPQAPGREPLSSLMSDSSTAAVTSAFSSLAHTVLMQNARTLDDLVRDMLRPMLKNWLDENLPTIVERLVRAEIERVSRGRG